MTVARRQGQVLERVEPEDVPGAPGELARSPDTFALRVRGDTLIEEQIGDGDVILAQSTPAAREGDTVVAQVRGEATVMRLHRRDGRVLLQSAGERTAPIVAAEEDVEIRGVVVAVIRKY